MLKFLRKEASKEEWKKAVYLYFFLYFVSLKTQDALKEVKACNSIMPYTFQVSWESHGIIINMPFSSQRYPALVKKLHNYDHLNHDYRNLKKELLPLLLLSIIWRKNQITIIPFPPKEILITEELCQVGGILFDPSVSDRDTQKEENTSVA